MLWDTVTPANTDGGPRFRYGQTHGRVNTPFGRPDGWVIGSAAPDARYAYGTIDYPNELTPEECWRFDLVPLGRVA